MSAAIINRSLTSVRTELEFLKDSEVISQGLYDQLLGKLPARHDNNSGPIQPFDLNSQNEKSLVNYNNPSSAAAAPPSYAQSPSQVPQQEMAEALYNYNPSGPTDLALYQGQHIKVLEKLNSDWWRGQDVNSQREGIFPSNYVRIISGGPPANEVMARNNNYYPPPQQQQQQQPQYNNNVYYPPPQQSQPPFPPSSTNYYAPPPQQQVVQQQPQQVQEQPQQSGSHSALADGAKKVGGKLGNAAIFGAGATIGSNIVNSIF